MPDINEVHRRLKEKKKERSELNRVLKDELAQNAEYKSVTDELKALKERRKSIEGAIKLNCLSEVDRMDVLKDEIAAETELLSDLALSLYMEGKSVEILEDETRYVPQFTVRFKKDEAPAHAAVIEAMQAERAKSHPERTFLPEKQTA